MVASSSQVNPKPQCRYGLLCQRKNPEHWLKFSHPTSVHFQGEETNWQQERLSVDTKEQQSGKSCVDSEEQKQWNHALSHITMPGTSNSNRILLMLVGLPGSGKSTFCNKLVQSNSLKWRRICQDIISSGKRGTKEQCLKEAEKALCQGFDVMIDRCNLTKDQRREFLLLARKVHAQAHALVLDLPVKICIQRAIQRKGHEGGLEGKSAPAAVQRMAQQKERPLELEGFTLIGTCSTEDDVERAFNMYNAGNSGKSVEKNVLRVQNAAKECVTERSLGKSVDEGIRTLAFPSISTSDFQFDHERAADIIVELAGDFLHKLKRLCLRLLFVDLKKESDMLVRVRQKATVYGLGPEEFMTIAGDITKLHSTCRLHCNFIANATNWRLKPGGGGVNAAIFNAAGEELEVETKKRAKTLTPGSALVVPLPATSPLHVTEGVTHVIHVLGPNMNPQRPNCLQGDYVEGSKLLKDAYSCMFRAFAAHVESLLDKPISQSSGLGKTESTRDAFTVLMQSAKRKLVGPDSEPKAKNPRQGAGQEETDVSTKNTLPRIMVNGFHFQEPNGVGSTELSSRDKIVVGEVEAQRSSFSLSSGSSKLKHWEPWAEALWKMVQHPEHHKDTILQVTDQVIVINDKFPKGKKHLLVVSRLDGLDSIEELRSSHLLLLQSMHSLGMAFVQSLLQQDDSLVFRMGYHSVPSMRQLHMHVISQDFDSPALENKKHWNSFTTTFFRDSKGVIDELKETGRVKPVGDERALLKIELRCHKCRSVQPNIPRLKQHIHCCQVAFPCDLAQKGFLMMAAKGGI